MGWFAEVIFLLILRYVTLTTGDLHTLHLPQNMVDEDIHQSLDKMGDDEMEISANQYEDVLLDRLGRVLATILVQPWPRGVSPILYIEDDPSDTISEQIPVENNLFEDEQISNAPFKRSRYYRKYPWKRQNSRYDAENRYLCQPTKEDVFRLLVALHEARRGSRGQMINFCNRKRPASAVFTNIRFLG